MFSMVCGYMYNNMLNSQHNKGTHVESEIHLVSSMMACIAISVYRKNEGNAGDN